MTRVLDALKALEKRQAGTTASPPAAAAPEPPRHEPGAKPEAARPESEASASRPAQPERIHPANEAVRRVAREHAVANMCLLPTVPVVADHYHELAESVSEQLSTNYCNVMLFVCTDPAAADAFSMTHLAQAFSLQSTGDVLLVDGDLHAGRLSKTVCPTGPGIVHAMTGSAQWPEIIHSTTTPRIDFVGRGEGDMPDGDVTEFGWGALRPKYRAVLIGVSDHKLRETAALAAHCDAVYLLVSRPHTKRQTAMEAAEALRVAGAHLMGCIIVND